MQGSSLRSVRSVRAAALLYTHPEEKVLDPPPVGPKGGAAESCSAPDCFWGTTVYCQLNHGNGDGDQAKLLLSLSLSGLPLSSQASRSRFQLRVEAQWQYCFLEPADASLPQANQILFFLLPMGSLLRDSRTLE
jgi:hypothetical protein